MGSTTSGRERRPRLGDALALGADTADVQALRRVSEGGVPATARLLSRAVTCGALGDHPVCELQLEVRVPGHAPYTTVARQPVPRMQEPALQPGATVAVKVDPHDPTIVVLDWLPRLPATDAAVAEGLTPTSGT